MDKPRPNKIYQFADFRLDAANLLLYQKGREIVLTPKVVETLLALVERSGEVVHKDRLMEIVWADSFVEEGNLSQNLYILRKTLSKTADGKPFIETLKRRGYRFNGDVSCVEARPTENSSAETRFYNEENRDAVQSLPDQRTDEREENTEHQNRPPGNLSAIVGREKEIVQIKNLLLEKDVRLVTLAGVGGAGKTRLARAVAQEISAAFPDGVFFTDLAAISNHELVTATIAQQFGLKEMSGKPVLENLKERLRDKKILIINDNFEQVIAASPVIAELLAAAENVKFLITSRMLLNLSAEREFIVPPLAVPFDATGISFAEISNYEAIKLFVERARNVKPAFALTVENAGDIAKICARLDGLPLAIELAAARIKVISPRAILSKLENRLKLLTGGARDLPARQQTMRGAIEWSYDLLNDEEKQLFSASRGIRGRFHL